MCSCSLRVTFRHDGRPEAQSLSLPGANWSFQPGNIDDHGVYGVVSADAGVLTPRANATAASDAHSRRRRTLMASPEK
jgi:hypothetical protein